MLFQLLVLQICSELQNVNYVACSQAFLAAGLETQVTQKVARLEEQSVVFLTREAEEVTSKEAVEVAGLVLYTVKSRSLTYNVRKEPDGLVPALAVNLGFDRCVVALKWTF